MNASLGPLVLALMVALASAEFYWKDNKIVRQSELVNDAALLKDNTMGTTLGGTVVAAAQTTSNSLNSYVIGGVEKQFAVVTPASVISGVVQQVVDPLQSIKFDCSGKPTGPNKDPKYCDVYHACVFGKQSKVYACEQMGERFYYDENLQRYVVLTEPRTELFWLLKSCS